jgi:hypothetical protein
MATIDREKVLTVLRRRFPGATSCDLAAAANAIMGLPEEWEDVTALEPDLPAHFAHRCGDACQLAIGNVDEAEFRVFRRRLP